MTPWPATAAGDEDEAMIDAHYAVAVAVLRRHTRKHKHNAILLSAYFPAARKIWVVSAVP